MGSVLLKYIWEFIKNRLSGHTLKYVVFARPGNQEEFLQDMKAERIPGLDISMGMAPHTYYTSGLKLQEYFPVLQADGREIELRDNSRLYTNKKNLERLSAQSAVFDKMLELASDIQKRGFRATINGKPVEEEKKEFEKYVSEERARLDASLADRI